jgi:hypothetical protein
LSIFESGCPSAALFGFIVFLLSGPSSETNNEQKQWEEVCGFRKSENKCYKTKKYL